MGRVLLVMGHRNTDPDDTIHTPAERARTLPLVEQAAALNASLGPLLSASDTPSADGGGAGNVCAPSLEGDGAAGAGTSLPPFDPSAPAEVPVVFRVSLTFAIS